MGDVVELDDARPHLTITGEDAVHVVPCLLIEEIISGKLPPAALICRERGNDLVRAILREWYDSIDG